MTKIEWTESTWNPITGCDKVSAGCLNCYADRMAKRLKAMGLEKYKNGFELTLHEDVLEDPIKWKKPQMIFVNSMSDLFHEKVPFSFIEKIFKVMEQSPQHVFQILTKRSKRLKKLHNKLYWPENVWMGVTVENQHYKYRINDLRTTNAGLKFLSLEPLLDNLGELDLEGIDWVIVGGESGPHSRKIEEKWVLDIKAQCQSQKVPFFFKQWGGVNKKKAGRLLKGKIWDQMPSAKSILIP